MLRLKLQYSGHLIGELTHWKRPWCWERSKAGGEGDDRGWDGWMASPTQWAWVWVNPRSWWWTGRPGVLQSMGSQRAGHDWATELSWTDCHSRWNWEKISKFLVILVSKSAVWTISLRITKRNSMILDHLEVSRLMNHCYMIFFSLFRKGQELVTPELMKNYIIPCSKKDSKWLAETESKSIFQNKIRYQGKEKNKKSIIRWSYGKVMHAIRVKARKL